MRKALPNLDPIILHVVIDKFDQESINKAVGDLVTKPVKIFVNCISSKRTHEKPEIDQAELERRKRAILKESVMTTDAQIREIIEKDDEMTNFEISTRAEIHWTGKEAIEGYASLVNMFLRSMVINSKQPCLINVNNVDKAFRQRRDIEEGQVFYHATIEFKSTFTELLARKVKSLQTINVNTNYHNMPDNEIHPSVANKLGDKTFAYIGLKK